MSVTHIFISPECLTSHLKPLLIGMEDKTRFSLLFVDESHCIVKWFVDEFTALILNLGINGKKVSYIFRGFFWTQGKATVASSAAHTEGIEQFMVVLCGGLFTKNRPHV